LAALNVLEGTVIWECQSRRRHQGVPRFLDRIDHSVDAALDIHLVLDNYRIYKHPEVNLDALGGEAGNPPRHEGGGRPEMIGWN